MSPSWPPRCLTGWCQFPGDEAAKAEEPRGAERPNAQRRAAGVSAAEVTRVRSVKAGVLMGGLSAAGPLSAHAWERREFTDELDGHEYKQEKAAA